MQFEDIKINSNAKVGRIDYLDRIKALACFLVVIGHFVMSMDESSIIPYNNLSKWFLEAIYSFHVPLFFLCSGFLYIYSVKRNNSYSYLSFTLKKLIALGVPYFSFSTLTVLMKNIANDSVNTQSDGLLYTLFINPASPYWYLYVLFFLFLIIPPLKSKKAVGIAFAVCLALKIVYCTDILSNINLPYFIGGIMKCSIWFVLGIAICVFEYKPSKKLLFIGAGLLLLFTALSVLKYHLNEKSLIAEFVLGAFAVIGIFMIYSSINIKAGFFTKFLIKYNLPIFLMHTMFAAGVRIVLNKIGFGMWYIQLPAGLIATFAGPAIAAFIMEKTKVLEFFLYPTKFVKIPTKINSK